MNNSGYSARRSVSVFYVLLMHEYQNWVYPVSGDATTMAYKGEAA